MNLLIAKLQKISKQTKLKGVIIYQVLLMILTIYFLVEDGSYIKPFLMLISIFHLYFVYISIIQNAKNNKILNQYALGVSLIGSYLFFREFSKSELILILLEIIQFFIVTVSIDLSIRTITQGVLRVHKHTYPFALLLIIPILLVKGIFTHEIIRLVVANIIFFFIYYLPFIMLIRNSHLFKNYGSHFKTKMFLFVGINIIYILVQLVGQESIIGEGYLFFIYLNSILCLLHFSVCTARKPTNKNKDREKIGLFIIVLMVFGVLAYLLRDDLLVLSYIGILSSVLFVINKEIHLFQILRNTKEEKDIESMNKLIQNIRDYKKEEIYKERMAAFLHDDILQDLLTVKRNLQDAQYLENTDNSVTIVEELINRTRDKMNVYKPYINNDFSLEENYRSLFDNLRKRYVDTRLIDFQCDHELYLSSPYDILIYRILHELTTNIYKHSKGDFSSIDLKVEGQRIHLTVINENDYLSNSKKDIYESRGLKIVNQEVEKFGGSFIMEEKSEKREKSLWIKIQIPIEKEITYDHFINHSQ